MNRLDYKMQQATLAEVIKDLGNIKMSSKKEKRTPSDIVSKITLLCSQWRSKGSVSEAMLTELEDNMWMVTDALRYTIGVGLELSMVEETK